AYFSFRRETQSGNWIEQFSTRSFFYTVEKSIYTQPFKDSNYWFTFKELYKKFIDYQDSGIISWEEFVNQNKEIIESVDPGGTLLSRIGIFDSFRTDDYTVIEKLQNESTERGLNILWYGAKNDASVSFKESVENAIADLPDYGGDIIIPAGEYLYQFEEQSTILNPTRIEIRKPNVRIIGIGKPRIHMKGLTKEYLDSIDDFASSGRDIFSLFSFIGVDGGSVS
ncbi:BppU family phage baseplate upper protein, partial [Enterococcus entomosocium]